MLHVPLSGRRSPARIAFRAPLAQLAEQLTLNQWVVGSSPTRGNDLRRRAVVISGLPKLPHPLPHLGTRAQKFVGDGEGGGTTVECPLHVPLASRDGSNQHRRTAGKMVVSLIKDGFSSHASAVTPSRVM